MTSTSTTSQSGDSATRSDPTSRTPMRADAERRHGERRTESQSAYIREQHRSDAEAGDASADVHEVRTRSQQPGGSGT